MKSYHHNGQNHRMMTQNRLKIKETPSKKSLKQLNLVKRDHEVKNRLVILSRTFQSQLKWTLLTKKKINSQIMNFLVYGSRTQLKRVRKQHQLKQRKLSQLLGNRRKENLAPLFKYKCNRCRIKKFNNLKYRKSKLKNKSRKKKGSCKLKNNSSLHSLLLR